MGAIGGAGVRPTGFRLAAEHIFLRNIDHHRPYLRYVDNLRREFSRATEDLSANWDNSNWPAYFRPVAASSPSFRRFVAICRIVEQEDESGAIFSLSNPSHRLLKAFNAFERTHIRDEISGGLTGRDWIDRGLTSEHAQYRAFSVLLLMLTGNRNRIPLGFFDN